MQVVFGVTNFFDTFHINTPEDTQEVETKQARNLADAAAQTSTLEHYVWSTTPSSLDVSNGKHSVPHFNSKSAVDKYIKSKPALLEKTTFLVCAFYANNMQWPLLVPNKLVSLILPVPRAKKSLLFFCGVNAADTHRLANCRQACVAAASPSLHDGHDHRLHLRQPRPLCESHRRPAEADAPGPLRAGRNGNADQG